ncbi:sugar phosphate isomerase/epimerase family protein [Comamonas kerstersii]|uniref:sugar phosphate isomerase/epimerase family protein n=1 Tax=Comamonas kerstersii TaxID=225992 RepID=UPI001B33FE61|nr:TIM barrel protein [Comamonas kerstersii]QTW18432.1 TIM barrel protein [Comamonas kerstersii]
MSNVSPLPEVLVSLTSFGAAEVRRHGQLWFAQLCAQAGANAVEVREELLVDAAQELPAIAQWLRTTSLWSVYSCPQPLFAMDGSLDEAVLAHAIAATHTLGAKWLKMSIGQFAAQSVADSALGFAQLQAKVQAAGITLLIENDQTVRAGSIRALQQFFAAADAAGLQLPMTFDMGNWHYVGECPMQAARSFAGRVGYVHTKGVQHPGKWVAVPLAQSTAPWRTLLNALPTDVPRAIEYPLIHDDLTGYTRQELDALRVATVI